MFFGTCIKNIFGICFKFSSLNTLMISFSGTSSALEEPSDAPMQSSNNSKSPPSLWSSAFTNFPCEEMVSKMHPQDSDTHSSLTRKKFESCN